MAKTDSSSNLFDVKGKIALVTGASSGIGRQVATVLANHGVKVVALSRRENRLKELQKKVGENINPLGFDLNEQTNYQELKQAVENLVGSPDILIHAAGVNPRKPADEVNQPSWDHTLNLNVKVPFFISQQFIPSMKKKHWGRIVLFASLQSYRAFPNSIPYGTSKGAIAQLTRAMAEAWSGDGINTNAIGPGFFPTELTGVVFSDSERKAKNAAQTCIGRNGQLEDIDGPVLFLSSRASQYVTGQVLMVDGGFTAK